MQGLRPRNMGGVACRIQVTRVPMRLLYGINGTGNGHRSRALEVVPELLKHAAVDVLVSGHRHSMPFPFEVRYWKRGLSFAYRNGGVDLLGTAAGTNPVRLAADITSLEMSVYDGVITDFEPISAWAARRRGVPCTQVSHQASFRSGRTPRPTKRQLPAEFVMRHFAPCRTAFGLHFDRYDDFVHPPVVRTLVRELEPESGDRIVVYLPSVEIDRQVDVFRRTEALFTVFSGHVDAVREAAPNVRLEPASDRAFAEALARSRGVIGHAGFELPSEAMYLGKPMLALPIMGQYEQRCNAAALEGLGVAVIDGWPRVAAALPAWLADAPVVPLREITEPADLVRQVLASFH